MPDLPHTQRRPIEGKPVVGFEVWKWPEFKAFADRLGIEWGIPTRSLTIRIALDEVTTVIQEYIGNDFEQALKNREADTTTPHNEEYHTKELVGR